jgi:hypothetical protein
MRFVHPDHRAWARAGRHLLLAALFLLAPRSSFAAVHVVSNTGDDGSAGQLRTIVAAAVDGDVVIVPAGTIVLAMGSIGLTADLTLIGAGRDLTVLDGGGTSHVLSVAAGAEVVVSGVTIRNGVRTTGTGGGIENLGTLTLVDASVEDCRAEAGGGISNRAGAVLTLQTVTVRRNSTASITSLGGGLLNDGTMTITESTVSANATGGPTSSSNGGGIANAGTLTIANTTISGNTAFGAGGGGIHHTPFAGPLVLSNVTITDNRSSDYGGGLSLHGGHVTVVNSIVAGNRGSATKRQPDCTSGPTSFDAFSYSLLGDSNGCTLPAGAVGNVLDTNPRIAALADNGGPTETHALQPGSPAVDAGSDASCPLTDQRGTARPIDGNRDGVATCDIGAYERERR